MKEYYQFLYLKINYDVTWYAIQMHRIHFFFVTPLLPSWFQFFIFPFSFLMVWSHEKINWTASLLFPLTWSHNRSFLSVCLHLNVIFPCIWLLYWLMAIFSLPCSYLLWMLPPQIFPMSTPMSKNIITFVFDTVDCAIFVLLFIVLHYNEWLVCLFISNSSNCYFNFFHYFELLCLNEVSLLKSPFVLFFCCWNQFCQLYFVADCWLHCLFPLEDTVAQDSILSLVQVQLLKCLK